MKQYSEFEIDIFGDDFNKLSIHEKDQVKLDVFDYLLFENDKELFHAKWEEHETDMGEISKLFPFVFKLSLCGIDPCDLQVKYFYEGKMQLCCCKITFDKFNKSKLKEIKK